LADGSVFIYPFRAVLGARVGEDASAKLAMTDIRTAMWVGGATSFKLSQAFAPNSSGNPRWDLVYCQMIVDASGASQTRYVKDPTTGVVSAPSIAVTKTQSLAIGVQAGATGASPAFPSAPSDAGNTFYIPLAYVRIPNGFGPTSTIAANDINEVAQVFPVSRALGVSNVRPADIQYRIDGTMLTTTAQKWLPTANTRPRAYIPPSVVGEETLWIAFDFSAASSADWSHRTGEVIDASTTWDNRLFTWTAYVKTTAGTTAEFAWLKASTTEHLPCAPSSVMGVNVGVGFGQSFIEDDNDGQTPNHRNAFHLNHTALSAIPSGVIVAGSVGSNGVLQVRIVGDISGHCILVKLTASAPFPNV
jgi:hypothetical protein